MFSEFPPRGRIFTLIYYIVYSLHIIIRVSQQCFWFALYFKQGSFTSFLITIVRIMEIGHFINLFFQFQQMWFQIELNAFFNKFISGPEKGRHFNWRGRGFEGSEDSSSCSPGKSSEVRIRGRSLAASTQANESILEVGTRKGLQRRKRKVAPMNERAWNLWDFRMIKNAFV